MKLYEITNNFLEFKNLCDNDEIPPEAIADTLESIQAEFDEKADAIACMIKNLIAESEAIKNEINRLKEREKRKINNAKSLQEYLKKEMENIGKTRIESARNKISIRKNPPSVDYDDKFLGWAKNHAQHLLKYAEPTPILSKIKEALNENQEIPHSWLVRTERIEIK